MPSQVPSEPSASPPRAASAPRSAPDVATSQGDAATIVSGTDSAGRPVLDLAGRTLGKYEIRRRLGAGGMGAVFLAYDPMIDREVALKVLPPEFSRNETAAARFLGEARAVGQLSHANVIAIYDIGRQGDLQYLVMELATGGSVSLRLAQQGRLPFPEACRIVAEAGRGLAAAHARGLVHRDVKPENLMLAGDGTVKLVDFGLSKMLDFDAEAQTALTAAGQMLGTPYYMSPEQFTGGEIDARTDIYGLGATFYHLLTGAYPFPGRSIHQVMYAHLEAPRPDPRTVEPELPPECTEICAKALARKAADRYAAMIDFVAAVESLLPGKKPVPSTTVPRTASAARPAPAPQTSTGSRTDTATGSTSVAARPSSATMRRPAEVLLVEPSKLQARILRDAFARAGASSVRMATSAAEALDASARADVVVVAMHLPDMPGLEFVRERRARDPRSLILCTTSDDLASLPTDLSGACALVSKRVRPEMLVAIARTYAEAGFDAPETSGDPARLRLRIVSPDGAVPTPLAGLLRTVGVLDLTTAAAGRVPVAPGVPFDLEIRVANPPNAGLTTPSAVPDRGGRGDCRWSAVVEVDGSSVSFRALFGEGVAAGAGPAWDADRLRRLVDLVQAS